MPLVISMTLYKTESLRLHSNNDISSQFQVNIMAQKNVTEYRILQKKAIPADIRVTSLSDHGRVTPLSDHGRFTALVQVSDTLQQICEIRDIRFQL